MQLTDFHHDPLQQFATWYQQALDAAEVDIDAMASATATKDGRPSVRVVLYKGLSQGGFLIYTNYESRKAREIFENPLAALAIYWPKSYRQVRIEGRIEKISALESQQYFQTRSRSSQLGAIASPQSREISTRAELDNRMVELEHEYADKIITCPSFWGGFRLIPDMMEFWQGRPHRLHDRYCYRLIENTWKIVQLAP